MWDADCFLRDINLLELRYFIVLRLLPLPSPPAKFLDSLHSFDVGSVEATA